MTLEQNAKLAASRPMGVAQELTGAPLAAEAVYSRRVILIGEKTVLEHDNGRWCFLNSLRLLSRVVGDLEVVVPAGVPRLNQEVALVLENLWSQRNVYLVHEGQVKFEGAAAILNVGVAARADLPWTVINSNGWVARCTSSGVPLASGVSQSNPVGAMLAASFGVTEVFKRVYGISHEVAPPMENVSFSLFRMSMTDDDIGPVLPEVIHLPSTLLLGGGAIGNGLVLLLSQLPLRGRLLIMDKQSFGDENHGTCCLFDHADWMGEPKALKLATWLKSRTAMEVDGQPSTIQDALDKGQLMRMGIDLVLNGLDDNPARRAVQRLWPSLLVDGAINSVGATVVSHSLAHHEYACMQCTFVEAVVDEKGVQTKATGLSCSSLEGDPNRLLTDEDIANADEAARPWLYEQQRQGKTICSTIAAGMAERLGLQLAKGFRPSVPFVATASAAMVVAQMLRSRLWPAERFFHEYQIANLFIGPSTGARLFRLASKSCICTMHRPVIDSVAEQRKAVSSASG